MNPNGIETRAISAVKPTNVTIKANSLTKFQRVSMGGTMESINEDVDNCEDSSNLAWRGWIGMERDMLMNLLLDIHCRRV